MLNGKQFKTTSGGGDFTTIPSDKYTTQITDVNPKVQFNQFKNIEEEGLNYEFTILDNKTVEGKNDQGEAEPESLRGRKLWRYFSPSTEGVMSLGAKSNFRKLAEAALGKELTAEEKKDFNPESLINLQVDVFVEVVRGKGASADREFSNISSFIKNSKQLPAFDNEKVAAGADKVSESVEGAEEGFIESLDKGE